MSNESGFIELKPVKKKKRLKKKFIVFLVVFLLAVISLFSLFFYSDINKINKIEVCGNEFVSDEYIIDLVGIKKGDNYLLANGLKAKGDSLIDKVKVEKVKFGTINIKVKEKHFVAYNDDNSFMLFDENGNKVITKKDNIKNYYLLPYILDTQKNINLVCQNLAKLSNDSLFKISEIHNISFSYDANMVELVMDEGNYVYSSLNGLPYLENYLAIIANEQDESQKCILIIDQYSKAVKSDCSLIEDYLSKDN